MACEGYSKTALIGNWYEERFAPIQKTNQEQQGKFRPAEKEISFPNKGNLVPLARVTRREPWCTEGVIPDDGFVNSLLIFRENLDHYSIQHMTIKI